MSMLTHGHSPLRILVYQTIVWDAWIPIGFGGAVPWPRRMPLTPPRPCNVLVHVLAGCVVGVAHAAWWVGCMLRRCGPTTG